MITITGASQRVDKTVDGRWSAFYVCHKCGDEFASSWSNDCLTEAMARDESDAKFDKQQTRYCYRCGYKITDRKQATKNEYIAALNEQIDEFEKGRIAYIDKINGLKNEIKLLKNDIVKMAINETEQILPFDDESFDNALNLAEYLGYIRIEEGDENGQLELSIQDRKTKSISGSIGKYRGKKAKNRRTC